MESVNLNHNVEEFLRLELGLEPPRALVCGAERTFYSPRENTVYIASDATLCDIIHEVYGHALFEEQSEFGRRHQAHMANLSKLEDRLNLPENSTFHFLRTEGKTRIEENPQYGDSNAESRNCQYILHFNKRNKKALEYIQARQEAAETLNKIRPLHEGFAEWMETLVLQWLGEDDILKARLEELGKNEVYRGFINDEQRVGRISLLYGLGFPKSSDTDIVKKFAEENLGDLNQYRFIVFYGSGKRDIDIMAIGGSKTRDRVYTKHFDSVIYSEQEFGARMDAFDIEAVEAVLTGKCISGDVDVFNGLRDKLANSHPNSRAVEYALIMSLDSFNTAMHLFNCNRYEGRSKIILGSSIDEAARVVMNQEPIAHTGENLFNALNNATYALSYMLSALYYSQEKRTTTFNELRSSNEVLKDIVSHVKQVQNNETPLRESDIVTILETTQREWARLYSEL